MANVLIIYGSLTGNTQLIAEEIAQKLSNSDHSVMLKNAVECSPAFLSDAETLVLGASTWDDGLVQYDFADFLKDLEGENPNLTGKKFALFGCGDSNYEHFCKATDIIEKAFVDLGAQKLGETLKVDGFPQLPENTEAIEKWIAQLIENIK